MCKCASNSTWHIVSAYVLLIKIIVVVAHLTDHQQTCWLSQQSLWYSVSGEFMDITEESVFSIRSFLKLLLGPASRPNPLATAAQKAQPSQLGSASGRDLPAPIHTPITPDHLAQDSNWQSGPTAKGSSALMNSATEAGFRLSNQGVLPQDSGLGGPRQPQ